MKTRYNFTKHLKDRYKERILNQKSKSSESNLCSLILNDVFSSKENRTWTNNIDLVLYLYETYGNANYIILESQTTIFVCIKDESNLSLIHILTCWLKEKDLFLKNLHLNSMSKDAKIIRIKELKKQKKLLKNI